jgi:ABC-type transport system substrate-binding protein
VLKGGDKTLGDAVTVIDPYTVKIRQGSPNAFFLLVLSLHAMVQDARTDKSDQPGANDDRTRERRERAGLAAIGRSRSGLPIN